MAVISLVVATQLGSTRFAAGVAAAAGHGMTTAVTVSIDGATGRWTSTEPPTAVPGQAVANEPATASPVAASPVAASPVAASPVAASPVAASPVAASPVAASDAPQTITPTATGTPPVTEPSSPNEPKPTARS
jgi:hypothetical protein